MLELPYGNTRENYWGITGRTAWFFWYSASTDNAGEIANKENGYAGYIDTSCERDIYEQLKEIIEQKELLKE